MGFGDDQSPSETGVFSSLIRPERVLIDTSGDQNQAAVDERPPPPRSLTTIDTHNLSEMDRFIEGHLNDNDRAEVLVIDDQQFNTFATQE